MTDQNNHTDIAVMAERIENLTRRIETLDQKADVSRNRTNTILGGVVVACILMVVNIVVERL